MVQTVANQVGANSTAKPAPASTASISPARQADLAAVVTRAPMTDGTQIGRTLTGASQMGRLIDAERAYLSETAVDSWQRAGTPEEARRTAEIVKSDPRASATLATALARPAAELNATFQQGGTMMQGDGSVVGDLDEMKPNALLQEALRLDPRAAVAAFGGQEDAIGKSLADMPAADQARVYDAVRGGAIPAEAADRLVTSGLVHMQQRDMRDAGLQRSLGGALATVMQPDNPDLAERMTGILGTADGRDLLLKKEVPPQMRVWALGRIAANPDLDARTLKGGWESAPISRAFAAEAQAGMAAMGGTPAPPAAEGMLRNLGGDTAQVTAIPVTVTGRAFGAEVSTIYRIDSDRGQGAIVDDRGLEYADMAEWQSENRLRKGQMTFATEPGGAAVSMATPAVIDTSGERARQVGDGLAVTAACAAITVAVVSTAPVSVPAGVMTGFTAGGVASGGWMALRGAGGLASDADRGIDISDMSNPDVRGKWIDVAAGTLSIGAVSAAARAGTNASRTAQALRGASDALDIGAALGTSAHLAGNWSDMSAAERAGGIASVVLVAGLSATNANAARAAQGGAQGGGQATGQGGGLDIRPLPGAAPQAPGSQAPGSQPPGSQAPGVGGSFYGFNDPWSKQQALLALQETPSGRAVLNSLSYSHDTMPEAVDTFYDALRNFTMTDDRKLDLWNREFGTTFTQNARGTRPNGIQIGESGRVDVGRFVLDPDTTLVHTAHSHPSGSALDGAMVAAGLSIDDLTHLRERAVHVHATNPDAAVQISSVAWDGSVTTATIADSRASEITFELRPVNPAAVISRNILIGNNLIDGTTLVPPAIRDRVMFESELRAETVRSQSRDLGEYVPPMMPASALFVPVHPIVRGGGGAPPVSPSAVGAAVPPEPAGALALRDPAGAMVLYHEPLDLRPRRADPAEPVPSRDAQKQLSGRPEPKALPPPALEPPALEPPALEPPALEPPALEPPASEEPQGSGAADGRRHNRTQPVPSRYTPIELPSGSADIGLEHGPWQASSIRQDRPGADTRLEHGPWQADPIRGERPGVGGFIANVAHDLDASRRQFLHDVRHPEIGLPDFGGRGATPLERLGNNVADRLHLAREGLGRMALRRGDMTAEQMETNFAVAKGAGADRATWSEAILVKARKYAENNLKKNNDAQDLTRKVGIAMAASFVTANVVGVVSQIAALMINRRMPEPGQNITPGNVVAELQKMKADPDGYLDPRYTHDSNHVSGHLHEYVRNDGTQMDGSVLYFRRVPTDMYEALKAAQQAQRPGQIGVWDTEMIQLEDGQASREVWVEIRPNAWDEGSDRIQRARMNEYDGDNNIFGIQPAYSFGPEEDQTIEADLDAFIGGVYSGNSTRVRIGAPTTSGGQWGIGIRQQESMDWMKIGVGFGAYNYNEALTRDMTNDTQRSFEFLSMDLYSVAGERMRIRADANMTAAFTPYARARDTTYWETGASWKFAEIEGVNDAGRTITDTFGGYWEAQVYPADLRAQGSIFPEGRNRLGTEHRYGNSQGTMDLDLAPVQITTNRSADTVFDILVSVPGREERTWETSHAMPGQVDLVGAATLPSVTSPADRARIDAYIADNPEDTFTLTLPTMTNGVPDGGEVTVLYTRRDEDSGVMRVQGRDIALDLDDTNAVMAAGYHVETTARPGGAALVLHRGGDR